MGAVFEGANTRIHRRVAIKVLHASVARKETHVQRFEKEATAAGRIGSEHIVEVLDIGSLPGGELFMVMEFLEGEDLAARIKRHKRLTPHQAAPIVHEILEGLGAAHRAGIIHRDLKPENVYLLSSRAGRRDFVKVLDFGVSKFSALEGEGMSMTSTGAVMGTPYYLSPEQARGLKTIDARSDLYSVGVVLYQAVTGRLPFAAETFNELVFKIALEAPDPAESVVPNLDPAFAAIIGKAMVRDVNGRFQSAREFQQAIEEWMAMNPPLDAGRASGAGGAPGARTTRSGTMAMDQVVPADPAPPWTGGQPPAPTPSNPGVHYGNAGVGAGVNGPMGAGAPYPYPGAPVGAAYPGGPPGADPYAMHPGAQPGGYPLQAGTPVPYGQAPSGAPQMGVSSPSIGLSTTPQPGALNALGTTGAPPKKSGAMVAAVALGVLALAGGAVGAYMVFAGGGTATDPTTPTSTTATAQTAPTDPNAPPTAAPSQAPSQAPTAEPTGDTKPQASVEPTGVAPPGTGPTAPPLFGTWPPKPTGTGAATTTTTTTTPTATPTATTKPTGRVIGGEL
jgi:serine/threonine-protein kinase